MTNEPNAGGRKAAGNHERKTSPSIWPSWITGRIPGHEGEAPLDLVQAEGDVRLAVVVAGRCARRWLAFLAAARSHVRRQDAFAGRCTLVLIVVVLIVVSTAAQTAGARRRSERCVDGSRGSGVARFA
jgi:hypothetical protein